MDVEETILAKSKQEENEDNFGNSLELNSLNMIQTAGGKERAQAVDYVRWAVGAGMITGKPNGDGTFRIDPKGEATRAECAKMMTMFIKKYCAESFD